MNLARIQTIVGAGVLYTVLASGWPLGAQPPRPVAPAAEAIAPGPGATWSLAAVGDAIITRRIAQFDHKGDQRFQQLAQIIRNADAAFLNLEISLFRMSEFKGWPEVENGGNWEVGPPEAAVDLKTLGFDLFNRANNHTTDYGVEGMRTTTRLLDTLGLTHAGAGENLGQASRPGYFDSPKGRIALIGLATTFTPMSRAGAARPDMIGRPGLNALRSTAQYTVDPETMAILRNLAVRFGGRKIDDPEAPVSVLGRLYKPGSEISAIGTANPQDEARILREVRNAASLADFVIVTSHSHESGSRGAPKWLADFAKKCLDAGAVTYIMHGSHAVGGVEIYKGKPIFHGLGNFIFQNETIDPMPSDHYEQYGLPETALAGDLYDARFKGGTTGFPASPIAYESVIAVPTFRGSELIELRLYPIEMGQKAPRSQRGTPRIADPETGRKIINRVIEQSAALGTSIVYENGIGIWKSKASTPTASR